MTIRNITDYLTPNRNDHTDDTAAFTHALAAGPGIVQLPAGHFRIAGVTVPTGVTLQGSGDSTLLLPAHGHQGPVLLQQRVHSFAIKDLAIQSTPSIQPTVPSSAHSHGILIRHCHHYRINTITVRGFAFAGIEITRTPLGLTDAAFCDGGMLHQITASDNAIGVLFNTRGEYTVLSDSSILRNQTGVIIHAGNCRINACCISGNHDGIWIIDHENGSHGVISNCLINHNARYSLLARDMPNGMTINACCFFYGKILAQRAQRLHISNCQIDNPVTFEQGSNNAFFNNHLVYDAVKQPIQLEPDTRT